MTRLVKKIIQQKGAGLLNQPQKLEEELRSAGCAEREIHTLMLVLSGCPAVAATLTAGEPTRMEIRNLIRSITKETGLSVHAARRVLGELMSACGLISREAVIYSAWPSRALNAKRLPGAEKLAAELAREDELVRSLTQEIAGADADSAAFGRLQLLAEQGNAEAAYRLGMYFRDHPDAGDPRKAERYFEHAARLGYGPAHGALAGCLSRNVRQVGAAIRHISHPVAISGKEGRRWQSVMERLMKYQRTNLSRMKGLLQGQLLSALAMAVLLYLCGTEIWMVTAAGLQIVGLGWTLWGRCRKQHQSCAVPVYLLIAGWMLVLLGIMSGGGTA